MPHFASLDELVEFFDTHDLGEYWDQMPEAHFEVDIKRRTIPGAYQFMAEREDIGTGIKATDQDNQQHNACWVRDE